MLRVSNSNPGAEQAERNMPRGQNMKSGTEESGKCLLRDPGVMSAEDCVYDFPGRTLGDGTEVLTACAKRDGGDEAADNSNA